MRSALRFMLAVFLFMGTQALAQNNQDTDPQIKALLERIDALEKKQASETQALTDELAQVKTKVAVPELEYKSFSGLGLGASKVYYSKSPLSIGGYGEVTYFDYRGGPKADYSDMYRFVPYIGYRFTDNIIFNSEIEFEHGGAAGGSGEAIVEFAYMDFLIQDSFNVRAGHVLVPVGYINLKHEPTLFFSVNRPEIEKYIIPTTWHENGVLAFGSWSGFEYQAGVVNGMESTELGLDADSWMRGGRQKGAKAKSEDLAYVARLEYTGMPGFNIGGSYYIGDSAQTINGSYNAQMTLWEAHTEYNIAGFGLRALYTQGRLTDAADVSAVGDAIGEEANGYYVTLSYDIMTAFGIAGRSLPVFVRHSQYDLHAEVPQGFVRDEALNKTLTTIGINYKPISNVVLKADYQIRETKAGDDVDMFELGLGWVF